ncbi:MAG: hypothetical protein AB1352_02705 [Patescibacteria group bacterium]
MKHREHAGHHELKEKKRTEWDRSHPVTVKLLQGGAQQFMSDLHHLKEAFSAEMHCVCCMDEGTAHMERGSKLFMAGSGILYPAARWDERLERVVQLFIDSQITEITSHDGCGAASIAFQRDGGEEGTGCATADEYGKKWCRELQEKMNEKLVIVEKMGEGIDNVHIHENEMARPPEFHVARVVWFDTTGEFTKPEVLVEEIPKGFAINYHAFASREMASYPLSELEVAIKIAFSEHGFDEEFTKDHPFCIIVIAENEEMKEEAMKMIEEVIQGNEEISKFKERIKIDGFVKP